MKRELDLADIQGNIIRGYGAYGFRAARYFCLHVHDAKAGRGVVDAVRREVTTAERWTRGGLTAAGRGAATAPRPEVTVNIAFTFLGLLNLGLPTRTLRLMPDEFIDGMARRANILGDVGPSAVEHWDPVWRAGVAGDREVKDPRHKGVHIWISMNAQAGADGQPVPELEAKTQWLRGLCRDSGGKVELLKGHAPDDGDYQSGNVVMQEVEGKKVPTPKEHFGFTDGIGNPVFLGQYSEDIEAQQVIGRGKLMPDQSWQPLATGEFILGYPDESQQLPEVAPPWEFMRNGTFMAYRKLHQDVAAFNRYIDSMAEGYAQLMGVEKQEAVATLRAKMAGRWDDGVPLSQAPTYQQWKSFAAGFGDPKNNDKDRKAYDKALRDFTYGDDMDGTKCPVTAHLRRVNPRDTLDPALVTGNTDKRNGSALNKRRRILRRGLPYGRYDGPDNDDGNHGIVFIALCASLFRQFEFVQQQWIHYGLDFNVGNDTCPLVGNHGDDTRFVIPAGPAGGKPPFICHDLPQFVTVRGGDYFFIPSMTALRMIAQGVVDPT